MAKILITGGTGQVLTSATQALAREHDVWCIGRFESDAARQALETGGIRTAKWTMGVDSLVAVPDDFTYVVHGARRAARDSDFEPAIADQCVGVAMLMQHCRQAEAFLYLSSSAVYTRAVADHPQTESDPTGGNSPHMPSYAISKIAAEGTVRGLCATLNIPSLMARVNVAYGPHGWGGLPMRYLGAMLQGEPVPLPLDGDNYLNPIHTDDIAEQLPGLLDAAAVPATVVNWAGDETITEAQLARYMAAITDVPLKFERRAVTASPSAADNSRRMRLVGPCRVGWREGIRSSIKAHFPDLAVSELDP